MWEMRHFDFCRFLVLKWLKFGLHDGAFSLTWQMSSSWWHNRLYVMNVGTKYNAHPVVVELFQSGPKWWTDRTTDRLYQPQSHTASMAENIESHPHMLSLYLWLLFTWQWEELSPVCYTGLHLSLLSQARCKRLLSCPRRLRQSIMKEVM